MVSDDRVSEISHKVLDALWKSDQVDFPVEPKALLGIKNSVRDYFRFAEEIDEAVRRKLASYANAKMPGSRDYEILYKKFYAEESAKRR